MTEVTDASIATVGAGRQYGDFWALRECTIALPAGSVTVARKSRIALLFSLVGNDQPPLELAVVVPSLVAPSKTVTVPPAAAEPDRFQSPPLRATLVIEAGAGGVPTCPVLTVAVTADVVVVLPASSVTLAVKLWLPSRSTGVTNVQSVVLSAVKFAIPSKVAPS